MTDVELNFALGPNGDVLTVVGPDEVVNRMKNVLLTPRGSIPMRPDIGTSQSLFNNIDASSESLKREVEEVIDKFVPEAVLQDVKVSVDKHTVKTTIFLQVGGEGKTINV